MAVTYGRARTTKSHDNFVKIHPIWAFSVINTKSRLEVVDCKMKIDFVYTDKKKEEMKLILLS